MTRRPYPTDLSDVEWRVMEPFIPAAKAGGRPPLHERREIVNAICYVLRSGCAWRLLPHDLPPWQTVYHYFRNWRDAGVFEHLNHGLREAVRERVGRARRIGTHEAAHLEAQLRAHPSATRAEHSQLWEAATGVRVSVAAMGRTIQRLGWTRQRRPTGP
jgi:transposase